MVGTITFKKFTGEQLPHWEEYVKQYCKEHENIEVMIGTDSQTRGSKTVFSTIIAMYDKGDGEHGHGGHCVFRRWATPKYSKERRQERLLKEVEESINVARTLRDAGVKVGCIDLDINPNAGEKNQNKSNEVFEAAKGWVMGEGFDVRWKTLGPLITTMADWLVKN
jgi:predicted RNase H-related nuclease YkuK (DUF458 family)